MGGKKPVAATAPAAMTKRARPGKASSPVKKAGERATAKKSGRQRGSKSFAVAKRDEGQRAGNRSFPVVGIGASPGSLEALRQLLEHLPVDTGMAFVLVSHLDPTHKSILAELLARSTRLPVSEVSDGMKVEPDHVYVMPPNTSMAIVESVLRLRPRGERRARRHPVDYFLRTLAEDQRHRAIGVILSGTDTDGTRGLESIKAEGGISFAEDPKSAKYGGMPRSAIAAGHVDFILTPQGIAEELARISRHPFVSPVATPVEEEQQPRGGFRKILALLYKATGVDFSDYKANTLHRRIGRRIILNKLGSLEDYAGYLRENAAEVEALYRDILISVTSFFRNPESFGVLKERIFPHVLKQHTPDEPLRIWTLGCSTGEETYSIAISLAEFAGDHAERIPIQIFATDLSNQSIEKARTGIYSKDIAKDVSPERLRRFFIEADGGYRVSSPIRDMVVFARHNIIADPPFSRLDLISCRNLLIYLEPVLQKQVLPTLHYALKPTGVLWLGTSETVAAASDLFAPEDKKHRFYSKKPASARWHFQSVFGDAARQSSGQKIGHVSEQLRGEYDAQKEADQILLARYAPAAVVINAEMEILQVRGSTGAYLESPPGKATLNLLKMAREGLMLPLCAAIQKAKNDGQTIRKEGVRVNYDGELRQVNLEVIPIKGFEAHERCFLVLFEPVAEGSGQKAIGSSQRGSSRTVREGLSKQKAGNRITARLQEEPVIREFIQSLVEQHEAANEKLQSASEEIQSSNEELQSINEELETSKEELESSNKELATLNDELHNRNQELTTLNNDLNNLHVSLNIPMLMLDRDLRVRRFTPQAEKVLSLTQADVGRPIGDIKLDINVFDLEELIVEVIDTSSVKEREVQDRQGRWYLMRVLPYRTLDNKIDGAVVVLVDIDALKQSEEALRRTKETLETFFDAAPLAILGLDLEGRITLWSSGAQQMFGWTAEETIGRVSPVVPEDGLADFQEMINRVVCEGPQTGMVYYRQKKDGERVQCSISSAPLRGGAGKATGVMVILEDITELKQHQEELRRSEEQYRELVEHINDVLYATDEKGVITYIGRAIEDSTGLSAAEITGHAFTEFIHPEDLPSVIESFQQSAAGQPKPTEFRILAKSGETRWLRKSSRPVFHDSRFNGTRGLVSDITERKRAEEELRASEERLRLLIGCVKDYAIFMLDCNGHIVSWNEGAKLLKGYEPEEIIGKHFSCFYSHEDIKGGKPERGLNTATVAGRYEDEGWRVRKDGSLFFASVIITPLRDEAGNLRGFSKVTRDITERKHVEEEREQLLGRLVTAQEEERRRLSRELHDQMGQSIAALMLGLKSLGNSAQFQPSTNDRLHQLQELTNQLARDVHHLASSLRPTALDDLGLHTALSNHIEEWSERSNITADFHSNGLIKQRLPPHIETTVYRIVQEALTNVLKHAQAQNVSVIVEHRENRVLVIVEDNGRGFDAEAMMDKPMSERRLGLLGMKERVSLVGGDLDIESTRDGGTTVLVQIPVSSDQLEAEPR